jgi:hypothetical protein
LTALADQCGRRSRVATLDLPHASTVHASFRVPRLAHAALRSDAESVSTKRALEPWAMQSVAFARALPPKEKK